MSHKDLREFIDVIEKHGDLRIVKGASWDLEMGSMVEFIYHVGKHPKPAIMFDEIPGYPKGYRTLYGMMGSTWRIAKTLELPEDDTKPMGLHESWYKKRKDIRLIKPIIVKSGPVLENTDTGDKIDVLKFPVPRAHELDGGRYIGTAHAAIQKDPDSGCVNLGAYRIMVVDKNHLAFHALHGKHGNIILNKFFAQKKVMPIAVATGIEPILWWVSCQSDTPWGMSEYDRAGGIKGEPIEIIEGPYSGLAIPARAEIVIEGEIHPGEYVDEGPFGEWHGYYANNGLDPVKEPLIRVKAVHYRNNPILTCSHPSVPPHTSVLMQAVSTSVMIRSRLESVGIPGIKGVWSHFAGSGGLFNVISLEQLYSGHSQQAGIIASQLSNSMGAYTVVVEEDIDPSKFDEVLWAMVTRTRLDRQIHIVPRCHESNVNPSIPPKEKMDGTELKQLTSSRVVIDACRDLSWKKDWYPVSRMSTEQKAKTLEKWKSFLSEFI